MKILFSLPPDDGEYHGLCMTCHQDGVIRFKDDEGFIKFRCPHCQAVNDRYIHIGYKPDDGVWWIDDAKELWHESAGVFVRRPDGKYLFFERIAYPLGYTIPAGHVDRQDLSPATTAIRELKEETGITAPSVTQIDEADIEGDKCIGGADSHKWSVFLATLTRDTDISIEDSEGRKPVWLTLEEASERELPFAIRFIIDHFGAKINAA
jgi:8-oxo-dGTP pyrophosphatase MutT (NUDIX family)